MRSNRHNVLQSLGAVIAGFLIITILTVATDIALHYIGIFPPLGQRVADKLLLLATAYRTLFGVAGCYLVARLAPSNPLGHALALGVVGLLLSIVGVVVTWNAGPAFEPKWYPLALVALALPSAWFGGKLREMQLEANSMTNHR